MELKSVVERLRAHGIVGWRRGKCKHVQVIHCRDKPATCATRERDEEPAVRFAVTDLGYAFNLL